MSTARKYEFTSETSVSQAQLQTDCLRGIPRSSDISRLIPNRRSPASCSEQRRLPLAPSFLRLVVKLHYPLEKVELRSSFGLLFRVRRADAEGEAILAVGDNYTNQLRQVVKPPSRKLDSKIT